MVVPELAASSAPAARLQPAQAAALDLELWSPVWRTPAPSARTQASVAAQSAPGEYPLMVEMPSASAASMA